MEQMTYLLFIKHLDAIQTQHEQQVQLSHKDIKNSIYQKKEYHLRWRNFKDSNQQIRFELSLRYKPTSDY